MRYHREQREKITESEYKTAAVLIWIVDFHRKKMSSAAFQRAAEDVKTLSKKPNDDQLLKLYGLYKRSSMPNEILWKISLFLFSSLEATVGDNNTSKPGMLDMKGKYKWEAWNANKGKSQADAEREYIALVEELKSK